MKELPVERWIVERHGECFVISIGECNGYRVWNEVVLVEPLEDRSCAKNFKSGQGFVQGSNRPAIG